MIKKWFLFGILGFCCLNIFAQTDSTKIYPKTIFPNKPELIDSKSDTLWVLRHSQFLNAIIAAKELKLANYENQELKNQTLTLKSIIQARTEEVELLKKDRDHYITNYNECIRDQKDLADAYKRQKWYLRASFIGIGVAFLAGYLIR